MSVTTTNHAQSAYQQAEALRSTLADRLATAAPEIWQSFVHGSGHEAAGTSGCASRRLPPNDIARALRSIPQAAPGTRDLLARYWMASIIADETLVNRPLTLPASVKTLHTAEVRRILAAIEDDQARVDIGEDRWKKNLAILTHRLIPVGAEFADPASGIPRGMLLKGDLAQRLSLLRTVVLDTGGFRPLLELHAHPDSLEGFHPEGWIETYHRLAEILALNPSYRGVMASSWFRDPALSSISPKLAYLRDYPLLHGARMLLTAVDAEGTSGALARSPTRQRLFREGRYVPKIFMMIWSRRSLLDWHRNAQRND